MAAIRIYRQIKTGQHVARQEKALEALKLG